MGLKAIFLSIWLIIAIFILTIFYKIGKKALLIFPDLDSNDIKFRDKKASGYSTQSWKSKQGGARNSLDIIMTSTELWTKSFILFAGIASRNDLIHKIPLNNINSIQKEDDSIKIDFNDDRNRNKQIVVIPKKLKDFINAIKANPITEKVYSIKEGSELINKSRKKVKYIILSLLSIICSVIVNYQYSTQKEKQERLTKNGQIASVTATHYTSLGTDYVNYFFTTQNGERIEDSRKIGDNFNEYVNSTVIYDPLNPRDYEFSFDFDSYSTIGRIIFMFCLYLPVMIFVTYQLIKGVLFLFLKIKI